MCAIRSQVPSPFQPCTHTFRQLICSSPDDQLHMPPKWNFSTQNLLGIAETAEEQRRITAEVREKNNSIPHLNPALPILILIFFPQIALRFASPLKQFYGNYIPCKKRTSHPRARMNAVISATKFQSEISSTICPICSMPHSHALCPLRVRTIHELKLQRAEDLFLYKFLKKTPPPSIKLNSLTQDISGFAKFNDHITTSAKKFSSLLNDSALAENLQPSENFREEFTLSRWRSALAFYWAHGCPQ